MLQQKCSKKMVQRHSGKQGLFLWIKNEETEPEAHTGHHPMLYEGVEALWSLDSKYVATPHEVWKKEHAPSFL